MTTMMPARRMVRGTSRCALAISSAALLCISAPNQRTTTIGRTELAVSPQLVETRSATATCAPLPEPLTTKMPASTRKMLSKASLTKKPTVEIHLPWRSEMIAPKVMPQMKSKANASSTSTSVTTLLPNRKLASPNQKILSAAIIITAAEPPIKSGTVIQ